MNLKGVTLKSTSIPRITRIDKEPSYSTINKSKNVVLAPMQYRFCCLTDKCVKTALSSCDSRLAKAFFEEVHLVFLQPTFLLFPRALLVSLQLVDFLFALLREPEFQWFKQDREMELMGKSYLGALRDFLKSQRTT